MEPCLVRDNIKVRAAIESRIKATKAKDMHLAKQIGVSKGHLGNWRRGERSALSQNKVIALAKVLGIEIDITVTLS
jgi:transcriptional regulator with XRE-family HTH domain